MPPKGRPRLTAEAYQARLEAYCATYKVAPLVTGIPPFPAGRRETPQHREWIALYKAHDRLGRRARGQCERCAAAVTDGSVFCDEPRADATARAASPGGSVEDRRALLKGQDGRCPICGLEVGLQDPVDQGHGPGRLLHVRCHQLVGLVFAQGPDVLGRLRSYLWPGRARAGAKTRKPLK